MFCVLQIVFSIYNSEFAFFPQHRHPWFLELSKGVFPKLTTTCVVQEVIQIKYNDLFFEKLFQRWNILGVERIILEYFCILCACPEIDDSFVHFFKKLNIFFRI